MVSSGHSPLSSSAWIIRIVNVGKDLQESPTFDATPPPIN